MFTRFSGAMIVVATLVITGGLVYAFINRTGNEIDVRDQISATSSIQATGTSTVSSEHLDTIATSSQPVQSVVRSDQSSIVPPIARASERVTRKPFGIHVSPQDSPVQPERFIGYHTGTDFETFPEEQDKDVSISAICSGVLLRAGTASGYGGYAVESCEVNGEVVTVIYGHLKASSIQGKVGSTLSAGETFAILGKGYSKETDGERKHLHLGIIKGKTVNIRGYVSTKSALSGWLDYQSLIK